MKLTDAEGCFAVSFWVLFLIRNSLFKKTLSIVSFECSNYSGVARLKDTGEVWQEKVDFEICKGKALQSFGMTTKVIDKKE